jgi:glycosyltransferase involved in cell wall biosynthesis
LPKVLHAIANFDLGGSSRLLIDLIEHLGGSYSQEIVTSHIPKPPVYGGVDVTELPQGTALARVVEMITRIKPDFIHLHYWGECDQPWYTLIFKAAEVLSIPVIQNVNTPVAPYVSSSVWRNVFVSETIQRQFGGRGTPEVMIYPGSDFSLFRRAKDAEIAEDCLGMVYRLENDKLNAAAIDPFIQCVRIRPKTRVLIVGGGSLLDPFKAAVEEAGVAHAFEFTGYVSYEKLPELYQRMSVFVAPVWKESFGQVSPFAMSMHLPVIGYDVGAIPEIVDDPSLVVPVGDSAALAALMAGLLDDQPRRIEIGLRNSRRATELFSVGSMIAAYRDLYALNPTLAP